MAEPRCNACDEIRQNAPDFIINGLTDDMCASLANNTGLSPSSGNDSCEDLENLNDCLIAGSVSEIPSYQNCDWKVYAKRFGSNVWTTIKGIICTICGINCRVDKMIEGYRFNIGEEKTDSSYMVAGKGVTYLMDSTEDDFASDVTLFLVGGGLMKMSGTVRFHTDDFSEPTGVSGYNYDLDDTGGSHLEPRKSNSRKGNSEWSTTGGAKHMVDGGELVWEIRILRSAYPEVKRFFQGFGQNLNTGSYTVSVYVFDEGEYAYGQHGACYDKDSTSHTPGDPKDNGFSYGHQVEEGYTYIQCRMNWANQLAGSSGTIRTTPTTLLGMRYEKSKITC